jgi:hypothetical protein
MYSDGPHLDARRAVVDALSGELDRADRAEALNGASALCRKVSGEEARGATATRWAAMAQLLDATADLCRWDTAVTGAEQDADRHQRAAARKAEAATKLLARGTTAVDAAALAGIADKIRKTSDFGQIDPILAALAKVRLPLTAIEPRRNVRSQTRSRSPQADNATQQPKPRAVLIFMIDGVPISDLVRVRPDHVHRISVLMRVLDWPVDRPNATIRLTSVWSDSVFQAPPLTVARPGSDAQDPIAVEGEIELILRALDDQAFRLQPQVILADETGDEQMEVEVLGYRDLGITAFDLTLDPMTGSAAVDARFHEILSQVRNVVAKDELEAFARFYAAVTRAATAIQAQNIFREGTSVDEAAFQQEMERRLMADPTLEGRLERTQQAGGITDLVHDGLVCELKVERSKPVSLEDAASYLGQPIQYASGKQKQLSLLCILDMSPKKLPPGILANTMGAFEPSLHGLDDPMYSSTVGVLIIPGNLPVPSKWSGRDVAAEPAGGGE